jgi:predicted nuclease of predicted toxin-antitoxin system
MASNCEAIKVLKMARRRGENFDVTLVLCHNVETSKGSDLIRAPLELTHIPTKIISAQI